MTIRVWKALAGGFVATIMSASAALAATQSLATTFTTASISGGGGSASITGSFDVTSTVGVPESDVFSNVNLTLSSGLSGVGALTFSSAIDDPNNIGNARFWQTGYVEGSAYQDYFLSISFVTGAPGQGFTTENLYICSNNSCSSYDPIGGGGGQYTYVAAAVPEPASMVLFGSGLAGLLGLRRRCQRG